MSTQLWLISIAIFAAACQTVTQSDHIQHDAVRSAEKVRLCSVLESIAPGERRPVTVSGVFVVGPEHQTLYDANDLLCRLDVQPETWVEFAPSVQSDELDRLLRTRRPLEETRRAYVTFTGELYGPGVVAPDDLSFPQFAAFANRTRNRRYGHLNGYRTKLVVTRVADVKSAPESVSWPGDRSTRPMLAVERGEVPRYPEMALNVGITGDVVLEATVSEGRVSNVEVKSGDRMLANEAVQNVKTWQFAAATNAMFTTTFSFELEARRTGEDAAPRIELQMPEHVRITAAKNGW